MKQFSRKKLLVDRPVQSAFLWRALGYWLTCVFAVLLLLTFTNMLIEPIRLFVPDAEGPWLTYGPTGLCAVLFLPIVAYDFLRVTNRLVGPLLRLRKAMRALGAGEHVEPIRFRQGDFWGEFADEFNAVARRMHAAGGCCSKVPTPSAREEELASAASAN